MPFVASCALEHWLVNVLRREVHAVARTSERIPSPCEVKSDQKVLFLFYANSPNDSEPSWPLITRNRPFRLTLVPSCFELVCLHYLFIRLQEM